MARQGLSGTARKNVAGMTLYHGDCLEIMPQLPDHSVDCILADLPYGTTDAPWDVVIPMEPLWAEYKRLIKRGGAILLFSQLPFACDLINANRKWFRYEWIWHKTKAVGFLNAGKMPMKAHENILVFYESLPTFNEQRRKGFDNYVRESGKMQGGSFMGRQHTLCQ